MINLFALFVSEDGKQLLSRLYEAIFSFCAVKCPKDAEDVEVGELCRSAPPHPVRCPDLLTTCKIIEQKLDNKVLQHYYISRVVQEIEISQWDFKFRIFLAGNANFSPVMNN